MIGNLFRWERTRHNLAETGEDLFPLWTVTSGQPGICALFTTRCGGGSEGAYSSLNLGRDVGDDRRAIRENRARLLQVLGRCAPGRVQLLRQVHGAEAAVFSREPRGTETDPGWWRGPAADGAAARDAPFCLGMLFADCLPVYLVDLRTRAFGLAHAGWRGLTAGVIERTLEAMSRTWATEPGDCAAFLGPAIERSAYEVDEPVLRALRGWAPWWAEVVYPAARGRLRLDLTGAARRRLAECGVRSDRILAHPLGTYGAPGEFYSHRRDGGRTGRCAAILWVDAGIEGSGGGGLEL